VEALTAASKAAIIMLTKVLALESGVLWSDGKLYCPARFELRLVQASNIDEIATHIPVGRYGKPGDVAHLVSYLASEAASYMTGSVIVLDGGATAGRSRRS